MPSLKPLVSAIIVSYNTKSSTLDSLGSLSAGFRCASWEAIVVDNGSDDGSVEAIKAAYPDVQIIENRCNVGFGAANNQGMKAAEGDYFLLLNSDAFLHREAGDSMVHTMESSPDVSIVGPRILNPNGSLQVSCYPFPSPALAWLENLWFTRGYSEWDHDTKREVDFVIGACMLVRRAATEVTGDFDEAFFMYSEEADWQRRMRDNSWIVLFCPDSVVTHLGGGSGNGNKAIISSHFFRSLDRYEYKHHGLLGLIALRCAMICGCCIRALVWSVLICVPEKREIAVAKARMHLWLVFRQAVSWR